MVFYGILDYTMNNINKNQILFRNSLWGYINKGCTSAALRSSQKILGIKIQVRSKTHEANISRYVPFFIKYTAIGELEKKLPKKCKNLEIF
jgi:hypothetical protein